MKWRPLAPLVTAVLALFLGLIAQTQHNRALEGARAETQLARRDAAIATAATVAALTFADAQTARADSLEGVAARLAGRATAIRRVVIRETAALPQLPDTCAPALAALAKADTATATALAAFEREREAAAALRLALDTVATAARPLVVATAHLSDAAGALAKASRPSWLARLKPDVGLGAAVGIDPATNRFAKTVGVTLSWRLF